jgi:hypothetical protein
MMFSQSFYDSYQQQQGNFQNRGGLGHEEVKSAQAAPQGLQSQTSTGPQSQAGQPGGQQGYQPQPAPYYPYYPQNQYYGSPYGTPGYGVPQPFVKYPVYQPGPPSNPAAASPAATKPGAAAGLGTQTQANPYGSSLYGTQQEYDAGGYQSQQHQTSLGGLQSAGGGGYEKQLYNAGQGFIGLSGSQAAASPGSQLGQRSSPEASYKYSQGVAKADVAGAASGLGQPQGRPGVAQQGQQGYYGNNRFAASGQTAQQGQNPAYQQGAQEGFYSYPSRQQQQGYWQ